MSTTVPRDTLPLYQRVQPAGVAYPDFYASNDDALADLRRPE